MLDEDELLDLTEAEYESQLAHVRDVAFLKGKEAGRREARAEASRLLKAMCTLNGDGAKFAKALDELGGVPPIEKAWSESDHPRDDSGRFVSSKDIRDATRDPKRAEELRASVTDPEQRSKLDALLSEGKQPLGGTERSARERFDDATSPQFHDHEGHEHVGIHRGAFIAAVKGAAEHGDYDKASQKIAASEERAVRNAKTHWREAKKKAIAQFRADHPPGSENPFGAEEDQLAKAFDAAEAATIAAYRKLGGAADWLAHKVTNGEAEVLTDPESIARKEFEAAYQHAKDVYSQQTEAVWKVVKEIRDSLGGDAKGWKLGRYFKATEPEHRIAPERELLRAALEYAQQCLADGIDPEEGLHALYDLDGGAVLKAWDESQHPRDHGKFATKHGTSGTGHPHAGLNRHEKHRALAAAIGRFGQGDSDPLGYRAAGFPEDVDRAAFESDVRKVLAAHPNGLEFDELYAATGSRHDMSAHDFARAMTAIQDDADDLRFMGMSPDRLDTLKKDTDLATIDRDGDTVYQVRLRNAPAQPQGAAPAAAAAAAPQATATEFKHTSAEQRAKYAQMVGAGVSNMADAFVRSVSRRAGVPEDTVRAELEASVKKAWQPPLELELADAAAAFAQRCLKDGIDPEEGLHALYDLDADELDHVADGGAVLKAWDESLHPRDDGGRFVSKDKLNAAKSDPKLAKELKKRVTRPEERKKLDAILEGKSDPGKTQRGEARDATRRKRERVQANRDEARAIRDRLFAQYQAGEDLSADDLRSLIPHLGTMTHSELSDVRTFLGGAGASFGGGRRLEERRNRLVEWARGKALDSRMNEQGFTASEKEESKKVVAPEAKEPAPTDLAPAAPGDTAAPAKEEPAAKPVTAPAPKVRRRGDERAPSTEEFAAASTAGAPAGVPDTHVAAVNDVLAGERDPAARDYIESALHNHNGTPADLAQLLGSQIEERVQSASTGKHVTRTVPPAAHAATRRALLALGATEQGAAGDEVGWDSRLHQPPGDGAWSTGTPVRVVRPPVLMGGKVVSRGAVEPAATESPKPKKAKKSSVTVPERMPRSITHASHKSLKDNLKSQYVPPPPKPGELSLLLQRPQAGPQYFHEYAKGDVIRSGGVPVEGIKPEWLTDTVKNLLWQIKTEGHNETMPILADALQEAGADNEGMLASLRAKENKGWVGKLMGAGPQHYIVTAAKPGFTRGGEGFKRWEQAINARRANADEVDTYNLHSRARDIRQLLTGGVNEVVPENAAELRRELADIEAKIAAN